MFVYNVYLRTCEHMAPLCFHKYMFNVNRDLQSQSLSEQSLHYVSYVVTKKPTRKYIYSKC